VNDQLHPRQSGAADDESLSWERYFSNPIGWFPPEYSWENLSLDEQVEIWTGEMFWFFLNKPWRDNVARLLKHKVTSARKIEANMRALEQSLGSFFDEDWRGIGNSSAQNLEAERAVSAVRLVRALVAQQSVRNREWLSQMTSLLGPHGHLISTWCDTHLKSSGFQPHADRRPRHRPAMLLHVVAAELIERIKSERGLELQEATRFLAKRALASWKPSLRTKRGRRIDAKQRRRLVGSSDDPAEQLENLAASLTRNHSRQMRRRKARHLKRRTKHRQAR
jgi:hypothetical protein